MTRITPTTQTKSSTTIKRVWHLIDMKDQILGRVAPQISTLLQGKNKIDYAPYLDAGDFVVVINASHVKVTGKKSATSMMTYYSGYPSGKKDVTFQEMLKKNPQEIVRYAVAGMLPKNKLRDKRLARLYIFADDKHMHADKFVSVS